MHPGLRNGSLRETWTEESLPAKASSMPIFITWTTRRRDVVACSIPWRETRMPLRLRRETIIEALNQTCKPYFGDLEKMTYLAVLERMVELMAVGQNTRYEDGIWPDISYRQRIADFIRLAEARLSAAEHGEFEGLLQDLSALDAPADVIATFKAAYPSACDTAMHALDVDQFILESARGPGSR